MACFARARLGTAFANAAVVSSPPLIVDIMMSRLGRDYDLTALVQRVATASDLLSAVREVELAVPALIGATDATYIAGKRKAAHLGTMLVQPIGHAAALIVRRAAPAAPFGPHEVAALAAIASAVAPELERRTRES
jgi:hypothetical protein